MPAVFPSPFGPTWQSETADGSPAVGSKYFFYDAGTNTKIDTYTDSSGDVANPNPIELDSLGMPPDEVWFIQGQAYKVVWAPSTDTDPPTSPYRTWDNLYGLNNSQTDADVSEWIAYDDTATYISGTRFSVTGDRTSTFHVGRRVKTRNTGGNIYSTITDSVFGAVTTVTLDNDSGSLDSGLSQVYYGIISAVHPSISTVDGNWTATGFLTVGTDTIPSGTRAIIDKDGESNIPSLNVSTVLTLANSADEGANCYLQLISASDANTGVRFGDTDNNFKGALFYNHNDNVMTCYVNGAFEAWRAQEGYFMLGTDEPLFPSTTTKEGFTFGLAGADICTLSRNDNPTLQLQRTGSDGGICYFFRQTTQVGSISVDATSTAYNTSSNEDYKQFIGEFDPLKAIEIIKADPVRDWVWDEAHGGVYAVGWGAQTSYKISPSLATKGGWYKEGAEVDKDTEGAKYTEWGVDQGKRTPYLWAAVSHLIDKVAELEAKLAENAK